MEMMQRSAQQLLRCIPSPEILAQASICQLFGHLLQQIWNSDEPLDINTLNTLAGTVQKLLSSRQQMIALQEISTKIEESSLENAPSFGLNESFLSRLENQLNLL